MIAAERRRQVEEEGFDSHHDEEHVDGELAYAAACYAAPEPIFVKQQVSPSDIRFKDAWPWSWDNEWDKRQKHNRLRSLVIAGALIAAEIDRITGAEQQRPFNLHDMSVKEFNSLG